MQTLSRTGSPFCAEWKDEVTFSFLRVAEGTEYLRKRVETTACGRGVGFVFDWLEDLLRSRLVAWTQTAREVLVLCERAPRGLRASGMTQSALEVSLERQRRWHTERRKCRQFLAHHSGPLTLKGGSTTKVINASREVPREMLERGGKNCLAVWVVVLPGVHVCVRLLGLVRLRGVCWATALMLGAVVRSCCLVWSSGLVFFGFVLRAGFLPLLRTLCYGRGICWWLYVFSYGFCRTSFLSSPFRSLPSFPSLTCTSSVVHREADTLDGRTALKGVAGMTCKSRLCIASRRRGMRDSFIIVRPDVGCY